MARVARPDCTVVCKLINTHIHKRIQKHEKQRMTGMARPCAGKCNKYTHTHTLLNIDTMRKQSYIELEKEEIK